MSPPGSVVRDMEARLLNLAGEMARGARPAPVSSGAGKRTLRLPIWLAAPSPLLRAAAVLIVGVLIGYGLWGPRRATEPVMREVPGVSARRAADMPDADAVAAAFAPAEEEQRQTLQDLEARIAALERTIQTTYFSKVEAAMLHFVTGAAEGMLTPVSEETTRNLLSVTADLKAERKSADDARMTRLLGQIESVLLEMDRLSRERDLSGARHVASVIEQQGLLSTLQRLKVGLEE